MTAKGPRRIWVWSTLLIVVVGSVVALNWEWFRFAAAVVLSERRPALLADAQWDDPSSARKFQARFSAGASEGELVAWLESNKFTVDRRLSRASKPIPAVPCAEYIEVTWSKTSNDTLSSAAARVSEAGCL